MPSLIVDSLRRLAIAYELLEKGERDIDLEFLDLVGRFWANVEGAKDRDRRESANEHRKQIDSWKQQIKDGQIPASFKYK